MPEPTVVAGQMGVGALSAAIARAFAVRPARLLVGVEPTDAACVTESVLAGRVVTVPAAGSTCMAGLNCGTPSEVAFDTNLRGYDCFVTIDDSFAEDAVRLLHADGIDAGESGAAGLAGLLAERDALGLVGPTSCWSSSPSAPRTPRASGGSSRADPSGRTSRGVEHSLGPSPPDGDLRRDRRVATADENILAACGPSRAVTS